MPQVVEQFEPDPSAADLGVYRLKGGTVTCFPPVGVPDHRDIAQAIWRQLEPNYQPLWVTNDWISPNYGVTRVHHIALGRYAPDGDDRLLKQSHHLLLPLHRVYGRRVRRPIVLVDILDGLTDEERNWGMLPKWQPWDEMVLHWIRYFAHRARHETEEQRMERKRQAEVLAQQKGRLKTRGNVATAFRSFDTLKALGRATRAFTPSIHFGDAA